MIPDFNRLKIFSIVYTNRSVSKAAKELNLSQPAVSQHLKKLEKELRIPLFTRTSRTIVPTPAATRLFARMSPLINELKDEIKYLRRPLDTPYGPLHIGAPEIVCSRFLTGVCNTFRYRFPSVTFSITCDDREQLLSKLSRGEIDIALVELPPGLDENRLINPLYYSSQSLMSSDLIMVCSRSYFNRKVGGNMSYEHMVQRDYVASDARGIQVNQWFQHHFHRFSHDLNFVLTTNNPMIYLHGIMNGLGLGVIRSSVVHTELKEKSLVSISNAEQELTGDLSLVQLKHKEMSLTERSFISILTKELDAMKR